MGANNARVGPPPNFYNDAAKRPAAGPDERIACYPECSLDPVREFPDTPWGREAARRYFKSYEIVGNVMLGAANLGHWLLGRSAVSVVVKAGEYGRMIGWGTGQTAEDVAQTLRTTEQLTAKRVAELAKEGLPREWVEKQLQLYGRALAKGAEKLKNVQLTPRKALMEKILELRPK